MPLVVRLDREAVGRDDIDGARSKDSHSSAVINKLVVKTWPAPHAHSIWCSVITLNRFASASVVEEAPTGRRNPLANWRCTYRAASRAW